MGTINKKMFYTPDMEPSLSMRAELEMIDTLAAMDLGRHLLDYMDTLAKEVRASVKRELMIIIREVIDILSDNTTDDFTCSTNGESPAADATILPFCPGEESETLCFCRAVKENGSFCANRFWKLLFLSLFQFFVFNGI